MEGFKVIVMARLLSYSTIPKDKPVWLQKLQRAINQGYSLRGIEDSEIGWQELKDFVDWFIYKLYERRDIMVRSRITSYLMKEDGQTQLLIKRNGKLIQTYYISK